eukprot:1157206-Pelagomonas_calceolata.AAC.5
MGAASDRQHTVLCDALFAVQLGLLFPFEVGSGVPAPSAICWTLCDARYVLLAVHEVEQAACAAVDPQ